MSTPDTDTWQFSDAKAVANYAQRPLQVVPGFLDMQRMAALLLAERVPDDGHVLVLGAGGGLELKVFAQAQADWRFCGVDPSAEMLDLATKTLGDLAPRVDLHEGYIDSAPDGPFDGATCILTLHFIPAEERLQTLKNLCRRLKPGAPLVVAHHSAPAGEERAQWLARYGAFAIDSGMPAQGVQNIVASIEDHLPMLSPEEDEALLREAGFSDVSMFYAGFTFRGWVAYRGE